MRSRTNQIIIRLSDEEFADLNEKAGKVRGSREQFIRQCISGVDITVLSFQGFGDFPNKQNGRGPAGAG